MAYILGFAFSDGNIYKTSLSWDIQKRDLELLKKINKALQSTYPIKEQREFSCRLRINNQKLITGAIKRGLLPKKSLRLSFPQVPKLFLKHFIRGYLDGDGWVVLRNTKNEFDLGFVCGNRDFLEDLSKAVFKEIGIFGRVREKNKITPKGFKSKTFLMEYYTNNALKVGNWLYSNLSREDIYLKRKHEKYLEAVKLYNYLNSGTWGTRVIQDKLGKPMKDILYELFTTKHLNGKQIARVLKVHSSSIYRWLAKEGVRYPVHKKLVYG